MERDYTINRMIAERMRRNGIKSAFVARNAKIREDTFSRILHSKRPIYADELVPILDAVGIRIEEVTSEIRRSEG